MPQRAKPPISAWPLMPRTRSRLALAARHRRIDVDAVRAVEGRIEMPFEAAHEIGRQEGVDPRLRRLRDEMAEARQRHAGRAALVDHRGDAGMHADHVRVHAEPPADVTVDVGVRVDHARKHQPSANVDDLLGAGRQDVLLHGGDLAVADGDVHHAVDFGRGANDVSTAKQQVIGLVVGHGGLRRGSAVDMISLKYTLRACELFPAQLFATVARFLGIRRKASGS